MKAEDKQPVAATANGQPKVELKRTIGLWSGCAMIIGMMVGSGIFVSPRGVLQHSGSIGFALLVWCLSGLVALLGALCYAELGTSIATSGAEYTYINLAYGPVASYLYIWVVVTVIMPCGNAIAALTFANYVLQPFYTSPEVPDCAPPEHAVRLVAMSILLLLIYINAVTIKGSIRIQDTLSMTKVFALAMIVLYGAYYLAAGNPFRSLEGAVASAAATPPQESTGGGGGGGIWAGTKTSISELMRAFYSGFFTYSGWNALNAVNEEIKEPRRNIPRALVISMLLVTLIYILTNCSYFALLTKPEILNSDAIAVLFGERALTGWLSCVRFVMPLAVALSTAGGLNATIFAASRIYYAAARQGQLFDAIQTINVTNFTPIVSLLLLGATSMLYLFTTKIMSLIEYMTFVEASFLALGVSTLLALRWQLPDLERPIRVPLAVPVVYLVFTAGMLVLPLAESPAEPLTGLAITLTGLPVYYLTANWREKPRLYQRSIDGVNGFLQKLTVSVAASCE